MLSENDIGVSNHLRNAQYFGSLKPFFSFRWAFGSLGSLEMKCLASRFSLRLPTGHVLQILWWITRWIWGTWTRILSSGCERKFGYMHKVQAKQDGWTWFYRAGPLVLVLVLVLVVVVVVVVVAVAVAVAVAVVVVVVVVVVVGLLVKSQQKLVKSLDILGLDTPF